MLRPRLKLIIFILYFFLTFIIIMALIYFCNCLPLIHIHVKITLMSTHATKWEDKHWIDTQNYVIELNSTFKFIFLIFSILQHSHLPFTEFTVSESEKFITFSGCLMTLNFEIDSPLVISSSDCRTISFLPTCKNPN